MPQASLHPVAMSQLAAPRNPARGPLPGSQLPSLSQEGLERRAAGPGSQLPFGGRKSRIHF